ncbi:transporter substrate-binding domain-containing protein [Vibrio cholerae]|nr:transporter substrate-binding domain-containing protein [Vibrio cholerae]EGQ9331581.1 transporter substrate-binding domain-containing protein [Vibrio cholerae]EIA3089887.1 transporter substrate-binding domain-containing protein [Vibrio cholerae]EJL6319478.1 transporter substrate-binding domain-containing protein [Vibrio cholerae]EJL7020464.1 transporter substrate-binding domain-containing protein [Vibrio cholerae]
MFCFGREMCLFGRLFSILVLSLLGISQVKAYEIALGETYVNELFTEQNQLVKLTDDLTSIYQQIGISPTFVVLPDERAVRMSNEGYFQALDLRIGGLPNASNLIKVEPALYSMTVVAISANQTLFFDDLNALKDLKIVILNGTQYAKELNLGSQVYQVNSAQSAAEMVSKSRVDIWLTAVPVFFQVKNQYPKLKVVSNPLLQEELYHYVHQTQKDLLPQLSQSIEKWQQSQNLSIEPNNNLVK